MKKQKKQKKSKKFEPVPCPICNFLPRQKTTNDQIERSISVIFHKLWHKCRKSDIDYYCSDKIHYDHYQGEEIEKYCREEAKKSTVKDWNRFVKKWKKEHDFEETKT